jgi:diaminopimelate epimerase
MEGAGNDFVVLDNRTKCLNVEQIIALTPEIFDRKFGIGADGLLVLQSPENEKVDFTMLYRNADGSDAGMCGNGARCLALFALHHGFSSTQTFNVHKMVYKAEVHEDETVSIHFPMQLQPKERSLNGHHFIQADAGTEHLVTFVDMNALDDESRLVQIGHEIRFHEQVDPPGSNVNFVHPTNAHAIALQTYERGVENLTLACGTGALASAIATHHHQKSKETHSAYAVQVKGGTLTAAFNFDEPTQTYNQLILTGPAHFVFQGSISL